MLTSLNDYLHAKNRKQGLVLSSDIADQRILQSEWMRETTSHTQPKVIVPSTTFL